MGQVRREAEHLGVADRLRFLGYRRDVPALMLASRATVLPAGREGMPGVVMESMAPGAPVIGATPRGTRDLLAHGGGLLVPVGDVRALAKAMAYVADHPNESRAMGERGHRSIDAYSLERVIGMYEALYSEALGMGSGPEPLRLRAG